MFASRGRSSWERAKLQRINRCRSRWPSLMAARWPSMSMVLIQSKFSEPKFFGCWRRYENEKRIPKYCKCADVAHRTIFCCFDIHGCFQGCTCWRWFWKRNYSLAFLCIVWKLVENRFMTYTCTCTFIDVIIINDYGHGCECGNNILASQPQCFHGWVSEYASGSTVFWYAIYFRFFFDACFWLHEFVFREMAVWMYTCSFLCRIMCKYTCDGHHVRTENDYVFASFFVPCAWTFSHVYMHAYIYVCVTHV